MQSVVIIGAGRVAWNLVPAIAESGYRILTVYSLHEESCRQLGEKYGVPYTNDKHRIPPADLYICSVKDDAITDAVEGMDFGNGILVHTAGSVDMEVLKPFAGKYGVLYPLQSFSKQRRVDFSTLPFYVEACNEECLAELSGFARKMGSRVYPCNSVQRKKLHIAAVFASNFVNHMYALADKILTEEGLDFSELLPLIDETAAKVHSVRPQAAQTGPAVRHDAKILSSHIQCLDGYGKEIYTLVSKSIQDLQNEKFQGTTKTNQGLGF